MFDNVLVGIDEETRGADAIALARQLATADARVVFGHVYPKSDIDGAAAADRSGGQASDELLRTIRDTYSMNAELRSIGAPRVGAGLHRLAESTGADLLVLGSSRKGRSGRVYLRDESCLALNGLPSALAVAPLDYGPAPAPIGEVGVACSGSSESDVAVATSRSLASRIGATVSAFEALPLPVDDRVPHGWATFTSAVTELEARSRAQLADRFGVPGFAACGETIDELAVFSGSVDLLVAGSRNYGPPGRLMQGSTTQRLLRFARAPLLILIRIQVARVDAAPCAV